MTLRRERPTAILVGCFFMSFGYNAYFIAPASIVPVVQQTYGVDKTLVGVAISACLVGAILFSIPGGFVIDRYDNRRVMGLAVSAFVAAVVLTSLVISYPMLLFTRFLAGVASVFLFTMNAKVVGDVVPADRLGLATTIYVASAPTGFAFAQFATPRLVSAVGLWWTFGIYGVFSVFGYVVFIGSAPRSIRVGDNPSISELFSTVRDRSILLVSLSMACAYLLYIFLNSWLPTYATDVLGADVSTAGTVAALLPVTGLLARPTGGWISDRIGSSRRVIGSSFIATIPLLFAIAVVGGLTRFAVLVLVTGFVIQLAMGVYYVLVREISREEMAGTSLAVVGTIAYLGSLVGPPVGGWLIEVANWQIAFGFYMLVTVATVGFVFAVSERPA